VALARAIAHDYPVWRPAYVTAAVLGLLQVVRRAHWPGDVMAGAGLGLVAEAVAHRGQRFLAG
jgi:membrane-associated phospholipid phosphatase